VFLRSHRFRSQRAFTVVESLVMLLSLFILAMVTVACLIKISKGPDAPPESAVVTPATTS
jgi:competence protein ComGC